MAGRARCGSATHQDRLDTRHAEAWHDHQGRRSALAQGRLARDLLRKAHAARRQPDRPWRARRGRDADAAVSAPAPLIPAPRTRIVPALIAWLEGSALATWTRESGSIW